MWYASPQWRRLLQPRGLTRHKTPQAPIPVEPTIPMYMELLLPYLVNQCNDSIAHDSTVHEESNALLSRRLSHVVRRSEQSQMTA